MAAAGGGSPPQSPPKPPQIGEGQDVLARWTDGLLYLGVVKKVDTSRRGCLIQFEDNSQFFVLWKDISPGVFQEIVKSECHFINGTDRVKFVKRFIYNREQYVHFNSDVGLYVGDTSYGEKVARYWNSNPEWMEYRRDAVDRHCRHNYKLSSPFLVERRVPPSVSILVVPPSSRPGTSRLLCSVMDFYPAHIQVRWFQGQQELSGHVVATDVVPNGDWTYQLLVLLETPLQHGVSYTCQVEHVSLEQPLSRHWEMLPDTAHRKILTGIGGFVLGFVFLVLGLGFFLHKKSS
ncbi:class II histocompatibility antigen, B-L beta chain-like [Sylvia borin]